MERIIDIDISSLDGMISAMRKELTDKQMRTMMYRVYKRTGGTVKKILKTEIPREYEVKANYVGSHVGNPVMRSGAGDVGCVIPIRGTRGAIGGTYSASGGRHGWQSLRSGRYRIKAKIVKGQQSTFPELMGRQGWQPPFRNFSAAKLNNVAYTRIGKNRLPIRRVVGLAVPQMPLNRSREDVQDAIIETMKKNLDHEYKYITGQIQKKGR